LEHLRDELADQRRKEQLTPAGRGLLEEIKRLADSPEPPPRAILGRVNVLPPSDQAELVSMLGGKAAYREEAREGELRRKADLPRSMAETIRAAEVQELAAGRRVNPHMTLTSVLFGAPAS
jgi:hypothetical protein